MVSSSRLTMIDILKPKYRYIRKIRDLSFIIIEKERTQIFPSTKYWNYSGEWGIIEIGLDPTGVFRSMHVPGYLSLSVEKKFRSIADKKIDYGIPIFSTEFWKKENDINSYDMGVNYLFEKGDYGYEFDGMQLRLSINTEQISYIIEIPRVVRFEFDKDNKLISFSFPNLNFQELREISSCFP